MLSIVNDREYVVHYQKFPRISRFHAFLVIETATTQFILPLFSALFTNECDSLLFTC